MTLMEMFYVLCAVLFFAIPPAMIYADWKLEGGDQALYDEPKHLRVH